jgi:hypothetical protein
MPQHNGLFYMLGQSALTQMDLVTTSVVETNIDQVVVYPNPSMGKISINGIANFEQIQIIDIAGRLVYQEILDNSNIQNFEFDLQDGLYYLTLSNMNETVTKKIVIRK